MALGIEPRALYLLGKSSTREPIPRSYLYHIISAYYFYSKTKPWKLEGKNEKDRRREGGREGGRRENEKLSPNIPIVHRLGKPAEHRVPVGEVRLLLRHVLLAVAKHLREQAHKPICFFL